MSRWGNMLESMSGGRIVALYGWRIKRHRHDLYTKERKRDMSIFDELGTEKVLSLYKRMTLLRRFEEHVYFLFLQGEIPGTVHQYQGQEAVAVGICDHLSSSDWITSTHRPHGHALAKGIKPREALAELYGKATGCCGGKGGSMHLGDPAVGMVPAIAIVGGGNSVITGMGLAFKLQQTGQVAVCFFGEGATNEGAFHESLNFAAVQHLPIVFVCENNMYGASTAYHKVSLVENVADRARAYGISSEIVMVWTCLRFTRAEERPSALYVRGKDPFCWNVRHTVLWVIAVMTRAVIGRKKRKPTGKSAIQLCACVICSLQRLASARLFSKRLRMK